MRDRMSNWSCALCAGRSRANDSGNVRIKGMAFKGCLKFYRF
jgi:hypothetical protein